ncbi:MAG TPA: glycosyltransferase [Pyrinomonadaceae bacterium]|jgi:glycosyltransferase involved in cell wall biosynthesis/SAM-dependent methyltransferase|nr:glycosyltransferase [Pyrinomonadaceae bacterium]
MNRVAIVVQRCHESIVGGSESLAWQYATLLRDAYEVEVLTTTAVDISDWANALPEGLERREGVSIRRFNVTVGRSRYWTNLYERLQGSFSPFALGSRRTSNGQTHLRWSVPLQEEFILHQGPYSEPLTGFLKERWRDYHAVIFITYLYPTTYFGLLQLPRGCALLAPTLHDEQPAYLSAYKHAAHRAHSLIWLTDAERRVAGKLWGDLPGHVVAMGIDTRTRQPAEHRVPYLLYCGRIDLNKGCPELFSYFIKYKRDYPSKLRLVLTGKDDLGVPEHPDITFRGFVSDEEKFRLMAGAAVYVMPSPHESFSIVTLEAMAQRTPVLVSAASEVLTDHVRRSRAGRIYEDYESFAAAVNELLRDERLRAQMGEAGREYVVANYREEHVRTRLIEAVEDCARAQESSHDAPSNLIEPRIESITNDRADRAEREKSAEATTQSDPLLNCPPLPLPVGWSEDDLYDMLTTVRVEDGPPEEMRTYASTDFKRFVYTLGLVPEEPGLDVLELGANPYFQTTLLYKFRQARLHLANFLGRDKKSGVQKVFIGLTGEEISYAYQQFNIEEDVFPYADESMDVVLLCEIIEHLLLDPVHALIESRRVLRPGGRLILTTPNVISLDNVCKLAGGGNIYDPYSGYGPYGRHNREYNRHELILLLADNGFQMETMFTADIHKRYADTYFDLEKVKAAVKFRRSDLGQYVFCRSIVDESAKKKPAVRPDWLYRSFNKS